MSTWSNNQYGVSRASSPSPKWSGGFPRDLSPRPLSEADLEISRTNLSKVRTEASSLAQDFAKMRTQLRDLSGSGSSTQYLTPSSASRAVHSFDSNPQLSGGVLDLGSSLHSRVLGASMFDTKLAVGLEMGVERVKIDLDTETRQRVSRDADAHSRMDLIAREVNTRAVRQAESDLEVKKQQVELEQSIQRVEADVEAATQKWEARVDGTANRLSSEVEKASQRLEAHVNLTTQSCQSHVDATTQQLQGHVNSSMQRLQALVESTVQRLEAHVESAAQKLEAKFDNTTHRLEADLESTTQRLEMNVISATQRAELTLSATSQRLEAGLDAAKQGMQQALDSAREKLEAALQAAKLDIEVCSREHNALRKFIEGEAQFRRENEEIVRGLEGEVKSVKDALRKEAIGWSAARETLQDRVSRLDEVMLPRLSARLEDVHVQVEQVRAQGLQLQEQIDSQDLDGRIRRALRADRELAQEVLRNIQKLENNLASHVSVLESGVEGHQHLQTVGQARLEQRCAELAEEMERLAASRAGLMQGFDQKLNQRCSELAADVDRVVASRAALMHGFDQQLKELRQTMAGEFETALGGVRSTMGQHIDSSKAARESLRTELLGEHTSSAIRFQAELVKQLGSQSSHHEESGRRLGLLEQRVEVLASMSRSEPSEHTDMAAVERVISEHIARERSCRETAVVQLFADERSVQETARASQDDRLSLLDGRVGAMRKQLEDMAERSWELKELVGQLEGQVKDEMEAARSDLRGGGELCGKLHAELLSKLRSEMRSDLETQLKCRLVPVQSFLESIQSGAERARRSNLSLLSPGRSEISAGD